MSQDQQFATAQVMEIQRFTTYRMENKITEDTTTTAPVKDRKL